MLRIEEVIGRHALLEAALQGVAAVDDDAGDEAALGVEVVRRHAVAVIGSGLAALTLGSFGHGKARSISRPTPEDSAKLLGCSRLVHALFTPRDGTESREA